jgi:hypothetical protein
VPSLILLEFIKISISVAVRGVDFIVLFGFARTVTAVSPNPNPNK